MAGQVPLAREYAGANCPGSTESATCLLRATWSSSYSAALISICFIITRVTSQVESRVAHQKQLPVVHLFMNIILATDLFTSASQQTAVNFSTLASWF